MSNKNREWNILCWNVRGINSANKWLSVREKIEESNCSIICLQETKRKQFDAKYIKNFAPKRFDKYEYIPAQVASGGIIVIWNSSFFSAITLDRQQFSLSMQFTSNHS